MTITSKWKELLLKSGLPLEYEVKERFVKHRCTVWDEFHYVKLDENNVEKDFSYDLDANYWNGCSIDFMIECKYRTKDTGWFFLPDPYAYQEEADKDGFFNIGDYFVNERVKFQANPIKDKTYLGPLCLKGVELLDNSYIETNIRKAINQLTYAFIDKFTSSVNEQLYTEMFYDTVFITVPLIITNANLFLIKEQVTIQDIVKATKIEDISDEYNFLVYRNKTDNDLKKHNISKLNAYFNSTDKSYAQKHLYCYNHELEYFEEQIAGSPNYILIMHHTPDGSTYDELFKYIESLIDQKHPTAIKRRSPPPEYILEIDRQLKTIIERKNQNKNGR